MKNNNWVDAVEFIAVLAFIVLMIWLSVRR